MKDHVNAVRIPTPLRPVTLRAFPPPRTFNNGDTTMTTSPEGGGRSAAAAESSDHLKKPRPSSLVTNDGRGRGGPPFVTPPASSTPLGGTLGSSVFFGSGSEDDRMTPGPVRRVCALDAALAATTADKGDRYHPVTPSSSKESSSSSSLPLGSGEGKHVAPMTDGGGDTTDRGGGGGSSGGAWWRRASTGSPFHAAGGRNKDCVIEGDAISKSALKYDKRIGYDGTTLTPSAQLLKPTASSRGHRVVKSVIRPMPSHRYGTPASPPASQFRDRKSPSSSSSRSSSSASLNRKSPPTLSISKSFRKHWVKSQSSAGKEPRNLLPSPSTFPRTANLFQCLRTSSSSDESEGENPSDTDDEGSVSSQEEEWQRGAALLAGRGWLPFEGVLSPRVASALHSRPRTAEDIPTSTVDAEEPVARTPELSSRSSKPGCYSGGKQVELTFSEMVEDMRRAAMVSDGSLLSSDDQHSTKRSEVGLPSPAVHGLDPPAPFSPNHRGKGGATSSPPTSGGGHSICSEVMSSMMDNGDDIVEDNISEMQPANDGYGESGTPQEALKEGRKDTVQIFSQGFSSLILSPPSKQFTPPLPLRRRASWAPGKRSSSSDSAGGTDRAEHRALRLRSSVEDPVASQLMAKIGEEDARRHAMEVCSDAPPSIKGEHTARAADDRKAEAKHICEAPPSPSFAFSTSMPNLEAHFSPKRIPAGAPCDFRSATEQSGVAANMPPPSPLIREVSASLLDVKNHEDLSLLARPIPKRCPMPFELSS